MNHTLTAVVLFSNSNSFLKLQGPCCIVLFLCNGHFYFFLSLGFNDTGYKNDNNKKPLNTDKKSLIDFRPKTFLMDHLIAGLGGRFSAASPCQYLVQKMLLLGD